VAAGFPLTIEQDDGESLTLDAAPRRIASLSAYATDVFCALGAGDQLVAVEMFANCPAGSTEKPALDAFQPNLEVIAGYQPDLVYIDSDIGGVVPALREVGIPVLYLGIPNSIEEALERMELFAQVTGRSAEGEALVADIRARRDAVTAELGDINPGPRVFHELDETLYSAGPASYIGDFYTVLKAENIAADADNPYPQLTNEAIVAADPEVIVLADEAFGVTVESVKARPGWDVITAVQEDRICPVDPSLLSQPGSRIADALDALAACLYPDRFG
jgi:iron complex transport system substrate-binding protein